MKFKVDNIIYMTLYDKEHNPLWTTDKIDSTVVETEAEKWAETNPVNFIKKPEIGERMYISASVKGDRVLEIDGFYGGLDD